jgi:hypothetical protein
MRSEKTRADYFSRVYDGPGRVVSEYLEGTASTLGKQPSLPSTGGLKKFIARDSRHYAQFGLSGLQATRDNVFRDLTNLETVQNFDRNLFEATSSHCRNDKCKRNAELLEKSKAMLENLKPYVALAVEKPLAKVSKKSATTQTDPDTPGRKNVPQILDFAWTTNVKQRSAKLSSEPKFEVWKSVGTQTLEESRPVAAVDRKSSNKDQSCQVAVENELHKQELDTLLNSLHSAERSKSALEKKLSSLQIEV